MSTTKQKHESVTLDSSWSLDCAPQLAKAFVNAAALSLQRQHIVRKVFPSKLHLVQTKPGFSLDGQLVQVEVRRGDQVPDRDKRDAELEDQKLVNDLHQHALFSEPRLFDSTKGLGTDIDGAALYLEQDGGARIQLDEQGGLVLRLPLERQSRRNQGFGGSFALIQETVVQQLTAGIAYADWALDRIDPTQKLTHVSLAASIDASEHLGWRTQAEDYASPNSGPMGFGGGEEKPPVALDRPRAALRFDTANLAEDLMVQLRRQRKNK
ncbi:hypothetical protein ACSFBI_31490 [Variovorax sp. RB3P1]|uniref:hypothetical protein n=1 Tax=Variovorax sp. RB3P1 TaxID=3443732 RepID=UPI003F456806